VAPELRRPVEDQTGVDLSDVRIHRSRSAAARIERTGSDAAAVGDDIYFGLGSFQPSLPAGRALIQHELTHVAQQRVDGSTDDALVSAPTPERVLSAPYGALQLGSCDGDKKAKIMAKLRGGGALTRDEARAVMDAYKAMGTKDRDKTIADLYGYGASTPPIQVLLDALNDEDRIVTYRAEIRDMLQRVQARATEAASGSSFSAMAKKHGSHMESKFQAEALAVAKAEAKKKKLPPPKKASKADVKKTFESHVEKESEFKPQPNEWDALGKAGRAAWWPMAVAARDNVIALAKKEEPAMKLTKADIALEPKYIADEAQKRGMSLFALSGRPMKVGIKFIAAADANPRYVLGAVLHEIHGHPMHGGKTDAYAWKLFDESTKHFPSYTKPADRGSEKRLYGYPETEIYSEMIEAKHAIPISAADRKKGIKGSDRPSRNIKSMVGRLARNLEPSVAKAVLLGMWERFRIDPRLSPKALQLYKDAVNTTKGFKGLIK